MKTSWVLTEDDKSKVAASRRPPPAATAGDQEEISFKAGSGDLGSINIKTEAADAESVLGGLEQGLLSVKQRRPSSPMTPSQFRPVSSHMFPGPENSSSSDSQIYSASGVNMKRICMYFVSIANFAQVFHASTRQQRTPDCTLDPGTATPLPPWSPACRACFRFRFLRPPQCSRCRSPAMMACPWV